MTRFFNISIEVPQPLIIFWDINAVVETSVMLFAGWIIVKKSPKEMETYKWFLFNILISIYSLDMAIGVALRPISLFPLYGAFDVGVISQMLGRQWYPILPICLFILNNCTLSLVNGFIYRWIALRPTHWINEDKWRILYVCGTFQLVFASPESIILCFCKTPLAEREAYIRRVYPHLTHIFQAQSWDIFNPDMNPNNSYLLFSMSFFLVLFVVIAGWALVGIFKALKANKEHLSERTLRMHRKLTISLAIQASIPFTLYIFPIGVALFMVFNEVGEVQQACHWLLAVFTSHSNVNVLLMLSLTSSYRSEVKELVLKGAEKLTGKQLRATRVIEVTNSRLDE